MTNPNGFVTATRPVRKAARVTRNLLAKAARKASDIGFTALPIGGLVGSALEASDQTNLLAHSPAEQIKLLNKYSQSYNLSAYETYAKTAIDSLKQSTAALLNAKKPDGTDVPMDLSIFGQLGNDIAKHSANPGYDEELKKFKASLRAALPTTELNEVAKKFEELKAEIAKTDGPYQRPQEVIVAFNELRDIAEKNLKRDKIKALKDIDELFKDKANPPHRTPAKEALIKLLNIQEGNQDLATRENTDEKLSKEIAQIKAAVRAAYDKAEAELKETFEGKPASKEKDSQGKEIDVPEVQGLNKKIKIQKERSEADLLIRARHLENLEQQGFRLPAPLTGSISGAGLSDDEQKQRCLKNITLKELEEKEIKGRLYGTRQLVAKTLGGTEIKGENGKFSMEIPGTLNVAYHGAGDSRMETDFYDLVERTMADPNKETTGIHFDLRAEDDDLRREMVRNAYIAARKKGHLSPNEITMTVTGSQDEKLIFQNKNATEILEKLGLGGLEAEVASEIAAEKEERKEILSKETAADKSKATSIKDQVKGLRESATQGHDEVDPDNQQANQRTPGNRP